MIVAEMFEDMLEERDIRIEELKKRNGELAGQKASLERWLGEAKKYIKLLLMNCVGVYENTGKTIAEVQAEAKQFLKETGE